MNRTLTTRLAAVAAYATIAWQQSKSDTVWSPRLILEVIDADTNKPLPARFSVVIDRRELEPRWVGPHGLRFVSVHVSKRQTFVATFARGTGPVDVPLSPGTRRAEIHVTRGFDYIPATAKVEVTSDPVHVTVRLRRWNRLDEEGWRAADAHVHYDRIHPSGDRDWFDMMDADGLTYAEFMVLKDGMVPGVWARQYAYGRRGEGVEGRRLIVPGEEYRDRLQGHILLFGVTEIIQPIMAGTLESPHNWPLFFDVLQRARSGGAMIGPAHGATLGRSTTGIADAVLGAVDFWEIGNTAQWKLDAWYELANCGYILPPTAGTDLPNDPYRDPWQPFLGGMRMYARVGKSKGSEAFHAAVRRGEVFVTSGPVIRLTVNGQGPGSTVRLPVPGREVDIEAKVESPVGLQKLELVHNGTVLEAPVERHEEDGINTLVIRTRVRVNQSSWFAARAVGAPIEAVNTVAVAHTAAVQVLVGNRPVRSPETVRKLITALERQKRFYQENGNYAATEHRNRMAGLLDRAIVTLTREVARP